MSEEIALEVGNIYKAYTPLLAGSIGWFDFIKLCQRAHPQADEREIWLHASSISHPNDNPPGEKWPWVTIWIRSMEETPLFHEIWQWWRDDADAEEAAWLDQIEITQIAQWESDADYLWVHCRTKASKDTPTNWGCGFARRIDGKLTPWDAHREYLGQDVAS